MRTLVFWSFKGGSGRTLAMANLASLLARLGKKVVCLDLDLEAPGLTSALRRSDFKEGFLEYAVEWILAQDDPNPEDFEHRLEIEVLNELAQTPGLDAGSLSLIRAGKHDEDDYWRVIQSGIVSLIFPIDSNEYRTPDEAVRDDKKRVFWQGIRRAVEREGPDYFLIDTRTGLSPLSRTSIAQTAGYLNGEIVVFYVDKSEESVRGTAHFLDTTGENFPGIVGAIPISARLPKLLTEASYDERHQVESKLFVHREGTNARPVRALGSDPHVEKYGQTLIPPHGAAEYRPLLDDYLALAMDLFPELESIFPTALNHLPDEQRAYEQRTYLRTLLGVTDPRPNSYKLFEVRADGGMYNLADEELNIAFKVATFQQMLDVIWNAVSMPQDVDMGSALRRAGKVVGLKFGHTFRKDVLKIDLAPKTMFAEWCSFDSDVGWGSIEAELYHLDEKAGEDEDVDGGIVRIVKNAFAVNRERDVKADLCDFFAGYIEGVTSMLISNTYARSVGPIQAQMSGGTSVLKHRLEDCIRGGADACTFHFERLVDA